MFKKKKEEVTVSETFRRKIVDFAIHFPNQTIHVYRVNFRKKFMRFFPLCFFWILDGYIFLKRIKRRVVFNVVISQKRLMFFFFHTSAHILFLPLSTWIGFRSNIVLRCFFILTTVGYNVSELFFSACFGAKVQRTKQPFICVRLRTNSEYIMSTMKATDAKPLSIRNGHVISLY